jgi:hypothetical protein
MLRQSKPAYLQDLGKYRLWDNIFGFVVGEHRVNFPRMTIFR